MAEAARLLLDKTKQRRFEPKPVAVDAAPDPLLGSMRDAADELDEIVADAMKRRREEPWRTIHFDRVSAGYKPLYLHSPPRK
jgi:hypothetical protein